jgi:hypothetical protein
VKKRNGRKLPGLKAIIELPTNVSVDTVNIAMPAAMVAAVRRNFTVEMELYDFALALHRQQVAFVLRQRSRKH